ncbi:MAG: ABC transporter ATP-binding protein [Candidatus Kariarchaeaceae archaeon]
MVLLECNTMGQSDFIVVNDVTKFYGKFKALDGFSCEIPAGVTGLLGPNGAGKTTFIRALLGIHPISGGDMQFLDHTLPRDILTVKDMIGYQPEVDTRLHKTTCMRYTVHNARLAGLPREAAVQRAFDTLHYVGLEEARYRNLHEMSQGMLQKVKLAVALVHDPLLLILDEPTAGCDPDSREQVLNLIFDLGKNYGKNIMISTHLLPDIERSADYVVVMAQGRQVIQGDLKSILASSSETIQLQIRVSGDHDTFANVLRQQGYNVLSVNQTEISCLIDGNQKESFSFIFSLAKKNNMDVRMMTPYRQSLEDVFLEVIKPENGVVY